MLDTPREWFMLDVSAQLQVINTMSRLTMLFWDEMALVVNLLAITCEVIIWIIEADWASKLYLKVLALTWRNTKYYGLFAGNKAEESKND